MTDYVTDREQIEMIKKWWNDYGKAIAVAIVIGLLIGFGWRYWHQHERKQAASASSLYQSMDLAVSSGNANAAKQNAIQLIQNYRRSPYASMASLMLAKQAVANKDHSNALRQLEWVIKNTKMKQLEQIARLRAARILLAQNKSKQAMTMISTVSDKSYLPLIENIKADIYMAQGEPIKARKAYEQAKNGLNMLGMPDPLIEMKIAQPKNA